MLQQEYQSILEARDHGEFRAAVVRFARQLGFETVSAMTVIDHRVGDSEFITVNNTPSGYQEQFHDATEYRRDPVMQHCRRHSVPIVWDQTTYTEQGVGDLWEEQARFGFCTGVAVALHLPQGRHFHIGVDRDQPLPRDRSVLTRLVADLQLFAVHAQDSALRLFALPSAESDARPMLSARELEALRWTLDGKTAWELGTILGISERTAVFHVQNAMRKLDCTTKHQAALKALRLGLIGSPG